MARIALATAWFLLIAGFSTSLLPVLLPEQFAPDPAFSVRGLFNEVGHGYPQNTTWIIEAEPLWSGNLGEWFLEYGWLEAWFQGEPVFVVVVSDGEPEDLQNCIDDLFFDHCFPVFSSFELGEANGRYEITFGQLNTTCERAYSLDPPPTDSDIWMPCLEDPEFLLLGAGEPAPGSDWSEDRFVALGSTGFMIGLIGVAVVATRKRLIAPPSRNPFSDE